MARNLDSFEREVLVALIACHISPKFHAIGHRNGMDVGILLRSFCKNFEEQVKNRKYFYKNATMIKEGIVRLQSGIDSDLGKCVSPPPPSPPLSLILLMSLFLTSLLAAIVPSIVACLCVISSFSSLSPL